MFTHQNVGRAHSNVAKVLYCVSVYINCTPKWLRKPFRGAVVACFILFCIGGRTKQKKQIRVLFCVYFLFSFLNAKN